MTMKVSAGSSGTRRIQPPPRRGRATLRSARSADGARVVVGGVTRPPSKAVAARRNRPNTSRRGLRWWRLLVGLRDLLGVALTLAQRGVHRLLTGDRRGDLLGHLRAQIGELRDADVLDAGVGLISDPGVVNVH